MYINTQVSNQISSREEPVMKPVALILTNGLRSIVAKKFFLALKCIMLMVCCTSLEKKSNIEPATERLGSRGYLPMVGAYPT